MEFLDNLKNNLEVLDTLKNILKFLDTLKTILVFLHTLKKYLEFLDTLEKYFEIFGHPRNCFGILDTLKNLKALCRSPFETKWTGNTIDGAPWHFWMEQWMERDLHEAPPIADKRNYKSSSEK